MPGDDAGSVDFCVLNREARLPPYSLGFSMNLQQPEFLINHDVARKRAGAWVSERREGMFGEVLSLGDKMHLPGASDVEGGDKGACALRSATLQAQRQGGRLQDTAPTPQPLNLGKLAGQGDGEDAECANG